MELHVKGWCDGAAGGAAALQGMDAGHVEGVDGGIGGQARARIGFLRTQNHIPIVNMCVSIFMRYNCLSSPTYGLFCSSGGGINEIFKIDAKT